MSRKPVLVLLCWAIHMNGFQLRFQPYVGYDLFMLDIASTNLVHGIVFHKASPAVCFLQNLFL